MAVLTYSIHYPKPEKEALLIDAMHQAGKIIKACLAICTTTLSRRIATRRI
jgi:hypothetical protein